MPTLSPILPHTPLDERATAVDIAAAIRAGDRSAADVLDAHLARVAQRNPALNAIVVLDAERARAAAREADAAMARGERPGALHGVPVTVKDTFRVAGLTTSNGLSRPRPVVAHDDATVVARARAAGAVLVGKTNVPLASYDWQCRSPVYGLTRNPWDLARTPGGSTGGGAAAVAAGLAPIDLGSDVGGSLRVPAHFCGICGFKPTELRVSDDGHARVPGHAATLRSMMTLGPLARSVADLRLAFEVIAGADPRRPAMPPVVEIVEGASRADRPPRIAWAESFDGVPTSRETRAVLADVATRLAQAGLQVAPRLPSSFDAPALAELWGRVNGAEAGASSTGLMRLVFGLGARALLGASPLTRGLRRGAFGGVAGYLRALIERDEAIVALDAFLEEHDALVCPVAGVPAITHRRSGASVDVDGERGAYATVLGGYCTPFSLTGHPVVVLPAGQSADGLPIGIQIVGRRWHDLALLALAERIERVLGRGPTPV